LKEIKVLEWCYSKDLCDDSEIEEREDFINELENELFILRGNIE
jgi:ribosomal protein L29